jgi:hypothetical protein
VRAALNGFSKPWESVVRGIVAREHMPSWERLWDDFVQKELRIGSGLVSDVMGMMIRILLFLSPLNLSRSFPCLSVGLQLRHHPVYGT